MAHRKAKSPYQRYGKSPYRYSDLYQQWRAAAMKGDVRLAKQLSERHFEMCMRNEPQRPTLERRVAA